MTRRINYMLELARTVSTKSEERHKHGAVLAKGSRVLNTGFNRDVFSKFAHRHRGSREKNWLRAYASFSFVHGTQHAEIDAINCKNTNGATVYVVRTNNKGELMYSRPCGMCVASMRTAKIKTVIYSISEKEFGTLNL